MLKSSENLLLSPLELLEKRAFLVKDFSKNLAEEFFFLYILLILSTYIEYYILYLTLYILYYHSIFLLLVFYLLNVFYLTLSYYN